MRTIYTRSRIYTAHVILVLFSITLFVGCSGYQSVSYYQDGIYGDPPVQQAPQQAVNTTPIPQQSGTYYKNYFAEKASQGVQDNYYFTAAEQYQSPTPNQNSAGNYQAHGSWGDQAENINVNIIYNRPLGWNMGWGWYDAPYTFGRSSFWGHNYHPWYFTYGFNHHPFYNPYRFGWGYRGNYWNNWGYQNPYWDRRYYNRNVYRDAPIYTMLNGSRTITRNYTPSRTVRSVNSNSTITTNRTNARSTTRTNTNAQRSSTTTQRRSAVSNNNQTPTRTATRRYNSDSNSSSNNSSYKSSSSSSTNNYRSSTPSRTTNTTRSSSSSRSSNSSRRR